MRISTNELPKESENYLAELKGEQVKLCSDYFLLLNEISEILFLMFKIIPLHAGKAKFTKISDGGEWKVNSMKDIPNINSYSLPLENEHLFFWGLSIIKYKKLFAGGKRQFLKTGDIFSPEEETADQYFKNLRDKHFIHPVNNFEFSKCFAELSPTIEKEKKYLSLGVLHGKKYGDNKSNYETFVYLCYRVFSYILDQIKELSKSIDAELKTKSEESLYELPYCEFKIPGNDQITKGRK